ncbi:MAG: MFS transporter [Chloroflexota bacterium]|nr:MFS transporter [Chloroflexota bacterium]
MEIRHLHKNQQVATGRTPLGDRTFLRLLVNNTTAVMAVDMWMLTSGWLVLDMTNSPFWVGATASGQGLGMLGFGLLGGTLVDRLGSKRTLMVAQSVWLGSTITLGVLTLVGIIAVWQVMIGSLFGGIAIAMAAPAFHALAYDIAGKDRLLSALATLGAAETVSIIAAGVTAGTLIATFGVGPCFVVMGSIMGVAILILLSVPTTPRKLVQRDSMWKEAWEGLTYTLRIPTLRKLLTLSLLMEILGFSFLIMLPVIARDLLQTGPVGLGYLTSAFGVGSFFASVAIATRKDIVHKGRLLVLASIGSGVALILFASSQWYAISLILAGVVGMGLLTYDITMATLIQLAIPDETMRGRVLGLYSTTWGFTPIGGFISGAVANVLGANIAVGIGGTIILVYSTGWARSLTSIVKSSQTGQAST